MKKNALPTEDPVKDVLLADEAEGGKKSAKGKKKGGKRRKKRSRKAAIVMFVILLLLVIIAAGVIIIYFNIMDSRHKIIDAVNKLDPAYAQRLQSFDDLPERERSVNESEAQLKEEENRLSDIRIDLERRESEILNETQNPVPKYKQELTEEEIAELQSTSKIFASMEPEKAASSMAAIYSVDDMATIIHFMTPNAAANIMDNMEDRLVAQIAELLIADAP